MDLIDRRSAVRPVGLVTNLQPTCNRLKTDCISRQAAIDAINSIDNLDAKARGGIYFKLMGLPSAQPERKTGRWIGKYPVTSVCSECNYLIHDSKVKVFAYCPNCGAKME